MIAGKIDGVDGKISYVATELKDVKIGLDRKIDRVDHKIDRKINNLAKDNKTDIVDVKMGLETELKDVKIGLDRKIDDVKMGLEDKIDRVDRKIDDVAEDIKTVSKEQSTIKTGLVAIACICVVPQLPTFLAFLE